MGNPEKEYSKYRKVRVSLQALFDIDQITGYIANVNHQPENAIRVGNRFFDTFLRIEKNPLAFPECEYLPTKKKLYRKALCQSWLVIFKIKPEEILILGIIHNKRKPSRIKTNKRVK